MPVIASNRFGEEKQDGSSMTFFGSSFITDEYGNVIEEMDRTSSGLRVVEFDLEKIAQEREGWGVYRDRRVDLYSDILKLSINKTKKK